MARVMALATLCVLLQTALAQDPAAGRGRGAQGAAPADRPAPKSDVETWHFDDDIDHFDDDDIDAWSVLNFTAPPLAGVFFCATEAESNLECLACSNVELLTCSGARVTSG